jgi:NADPH:quinone reductase-like Zn-dependent oxidoreductase
MFDRYGDPAQLTVRDVPMPEPARDEVVVKVSAAAVNPIDWKILRGDLRILTRWRFPRHVGCDFSGTVATVGRGVSGLRVGDAVFGAIDMIKGDRGSMAEFARARAGECVLKPAATSFIQAAASGVSGIAALECVDRLGEARAGRRLLVFGASGGLGSAVVQIAKVRALHVTGVCSARNAEFVRQLGADEVVAYDREDVFARAERFDVIVDAVAAHSFGKCAPLLTRRGIYINSVPGTRATLDVVRARLFSKQTARVLMGRINAGQLRELARLLERGQLRPAIDRAFPLAEARQAIELSMTHRARGKIVITCSAEEIA